MNTAKRHGGNVQVYDDNLTDISENLFWLREALDETSVTNTALLRQIAETLTAIHQDILTRLTDPQTFPQQNTQTAPHVSLYQPDTRVIQLDGVRPIDAAITWLRENDPDLKLTAREAAIRANMSQATINRAQQKLRK